MRFFKIILGGNQRELAREKHIKKQQELKKKTSAEKKDGNRGLTLEERRHRYGKTVVMNFSKFLYCTFVLFMTLVGLFVF